jgi:imidazole glycerol-phosphate synthase subunit HisF
MIKPRIIPCLLLDNQDLVKTIKFSKKKYIGDPLNTIRIFNELETDELMILDIYASKNNKEPDFDFIEEIVSEAFMPLAVGGGIKSLDHASKLINLGIEKVIINTAALDSFDLIESISNKFGNQSVIISIDIKKSFFGNYHIYNHVSKRKLNIDISNYIKQAIEKGAGEVFLNLVDKDGMCNGYDLNFIKQVSKEITTPLIVCGGANKQEDFKNAINSGADACAAGSMFIYKGNYKAVMINYPKYNDILNLFKSEL